MQSFNLKAGQIISIVADALSSGSYNRIYDANNTATAPTTFAASSTTIVGPFTNDQRYEVDDIGLGVVCTIGRPDYSKLLVVATKVAAISTSATGTQIATAVNALIAALVANGLMAAS